MGDRFYEPAPHTLLGWGTGSTNLVRVAVSQPVPQRHPENLDVERERPVLDVVEVVLDPLRDAGVSAPAVDLRPPGHARAHPVAQHVLRKLLLELPHELRPFGPRPDERHLPLDDVDELRELVQAPAPQEPP